LADLIANPELNYMAVGDIDQCQPTGTMVLTPTGYKPIETIQTGDIVKVWNRHSGRVVGTKPVTVNSRPYDGYIHTIQTQNYVTRATNNHRFFVRWKRDVEKWVVYIMYKEGLGYRIGWCKLFTNKVRTYHLGQRTRIEEADMAWIIKVCDTPREASIYESIASIKWKVPTAMFKPIKQAKHYDEDAIKEIFNAADILDGRKCLREHGLNYKYPLYIRNQMPTGGRQRGTIFITAACNIIPHLMSVPTQDNNWELIIDNYTNRYKGDVYSFDVPEHKSYVADGIVTHNSIYAWRGALPEFMLEFKEKYGAKIVELSVNYRCAPAIMNAAGRCIENNENRFSRELTAHRDDEAIIKFIQAIDHDEEALLVKEEIQLLRADNVSYEGMRVLMRTNAQSRAIEEEFVRSKIPFIVLGSVSFYERKEIKDLLSYLRIMVDPRDALSGERAINRPFRYIGRRQLDSIRDRVGSYGSYVDAAESVLMNTRNQRGMQFVSLVRQFDVEEDSPSDVLRTIVRETDYINYLMEQEGTDSPETSRAGNVNELIASATRFKTVSEFVDHIDMQIKLRKRNQRKKVDSRVQVMTIHKAKGTEANTIFLIGANEGVIPHAKGDIEEERRLFYVAMTRAKDRLYISTISGEESGATVQFSPSRFTYEAGIVPDDNDDLTTPEPNDIVDESSEGSTHAHTENVQDISVESIHRRD
jgi:DNA helicase-2/ATP-dependent DNA helicase PcrA